jgi:hypothetical protein
MLRLFTRVQLAYVGLFFAACVGVFIYQANYVWPAQRCSGAAPSTVISAECGPAS